MARPMPLAAPVTTTETLNRSASEHHELLDLLCAGDGEGARELTMRHIGHAIGWWAGRAEPTEDPITANLEVDR